MFVAQREVNAQERLLQTKNRDKDSLSLVQFIVDKNWQKKVFDQRCMLIGTKRYILPEP